jgi:hypothetical protein
VVRSVGGVLSASCHPPTGPEPAKCFGLGRSPGPYPAQPLTTSTHAHCTWCHTGLQVLLVTRPTLVNSNTSVRFCSPYTFTIAICVSGGQFGDGNNRRTASFTDQFAAGLTFNQVTITNIDQRRMANIIDSSFFCAIGLVIQVATTSDLDACRKLPHADIVRKVATWLGILPPVLRF